jgi:hypothetical protein
VPQYVQNWEIDAVPEYPDGAPWSSELDVLMLPLLQKPQPIPIGKNKKRKSVLKYNESKILAAKMAIDTINAI